MTSSSSSSLPQQQPLLQQLVPTDETGASAFAATLRDVLEKEESNSKVVSSVVVGILDTGIDPAVGASSHVVDCTGAGDVDVSCETTAVYHSSNEASATDYYQVTTLTGRTLRLPTQWTYCPFPQAAETADGSSDTSKDTAAPTTTTGTSTPPTTIPLRLGWKRAYEIFPKRLQSRVAAERQTAWQAALAPHVQTVRHHLAQPQGSSPATAEDKLRKAEWEARLSILQDASASASAEDPGPLLDCVVFYDGTEYCAVVVADDDTTQASTSDDSSTNVVDLTHCPKPLYRYGYQQQYGTVGIRDQCNFGVQFYDHGRVLSLVTDASPHGTHVAGITAGVFQGAALSSSSSSSATSSPPLLRLVSLKIGDARLGSMETGTALTRALIQAQRYGCHVINLSYGEGAAVPNAGRFVSLAQQLVQQYQTIFVSSAGNNGPALSTVGAPGGTTSALLGIAAYVSPTMQQVLYSLPVEGTDTAEEEEDGTTNTTTTTTLEHQPPPNRYGDETHVGTTYTWSSVGPTTDGDWGVNLTAPGGAITTVSNWCLQKSQLMNGTSMSSPHATGCVALLLAACHARGWQPSPRQIKRALLNTAQTLPQLSVCQQGSGMIHVPAAWAYLETWLDVLPDVDYHVTLDSVAGSPRGIYLRQPHETSVAQTVSVSVEPQWPRQDTPTAESQQTKIDYEQHFTLVSTAPDWVKVASQFTLMNNGRSFKVDVDPRGLPPGLHTAQVLGMDAQYPDAGPMFRVPVTVTIPLATKTLPSSPDRVVDLGDLTFAPAETKRFFVVPPLGATWMDVVLTDTRDATAEASTKLYALHTVQLLPHAAYRDFEEAKYYSMRPGQVNVASIPVEAGVTVEIVVGRYWSTLGSTGLRTQVTFRGVRPVPDNVAMVCGEAGSLVRIVSDLADESILPSAKLTKWWTPLRPKENPVLQPLGDRDVFPARQTQIYELVLTYEFTQEEKGSITPRVPTTQGVLYESALESQLIMVYDGDKKLLGTADAWPSALAVPKGKVVLRMQLRHDNPVKLEALKEMPLWLERALEKEITLSVYSSREAMILGNGNFRKRILKKGNTAAVFFQEPPTTKIPSGCKPGDVLKGSFTLCSGEAALLGEGKRPKGFPISYTVGPKPAKASDPEPAEPTDERTVQEKVQEAVRDLKISQLNGLSSKEKEDGKFEELYDEFVQEYPKHLPLLMARLKYLDAHTSRKEKLNQVIESANAVLAEISEDELALHFGRKIDADDPKANKLDKQMKEKKGFLVEALARSAMAHAELNTDTSPKEFDELLKRMKAWVDIESEKLYLFLYLEREKRAKRYGLVVKAINKVLGKEIKDKDFLFPTSKSGLMKERAEALEKLGYTPLVDRDKTLRLVACPSSYAIF